MKRCGVHVVFLILAAWGALSAGAATITWTGAVSTNWHTAGNWDLGRTPESADDVVIDGGTRQPTLSVAGGATNIQSLSLGASVASTLTLANGDAEARKLVVAGSLTIGSTGVLTHADNTTSEVHRLHVSAGSLTLAAGGKIDVTALGYDAQKGPGIYTNCQIKSAAHGGQGRGYNMYGTLSPYPSLPFPAGTGYGSSVAPIRMGSGGGSQPGGGSAILNVAGETVIQGLLTADGHTSGNQSGSGGSVLLTTGALSGNGKISAKGYCTGSTAGAGGGRIAVVVTNGGSAGSVAMEAFGSYNPATGLSGPYVAACGTIYLKTTNGAYGRLIINNNSNFYPTASANGTLQSMTFLCADNGPVTNRFDEIILTNNALLVVGPDVTLDLTGTRIVCSDTITNEIRSRLILDSAGGRFILPSRFVVSNAVISQKGTNLVVWDADVVLAVKGMLTHEEGEGVRTNELHKLNLQVGGHLAIQPGGAIWLMGRGYALKKGPGYQGVGSGITAGSHGGQASGYSNGLYMATGNTYGSVTRPSTLGSGGDANSGGGAGILAVSGTCTVDGVISASAFTNEAETGSGGSLFLTAGALAGNGVIESISYGKIGGGAGGGGRIAVMLTNGTDFGSVTFNAAGGTNGYFGAAGTVYLKKAGEDYGRLIVSNHAYATPYLTLISPLVTDAEVGDVIVHSSGRLGLGALQRLTVHGSFSNAGSVVAYSGSELALAGTNDATVWCATNTSLGGLICTTAAKRVFFQAGKAVSVSNSLLLAGGTAGKLVLRSTSSGSAWTLTVKAGAAQSVTDVDVADSDASGGDPIATESCTDSGGNTNWNFDAAGPITWTGGSNTLWGEGANWDLARPPIPTDTEVILAPAANQPVLDAHREIANGFTIQSGASLTLGGYNLTVNGPATVAGSLVASVAETVTFATNADFTGGSFTPAFSTLRLQAAAGQTVTPGGNAFYAITISNAVPVVIADGFRAVSLTFDGAATGAVFQGAFTAGLFRCEAPGSALTFRDGAAFAVSNLMLRGTPASAVRLRSAVNGTPWGLAVSGWRFVRYADVRDSDASAGKPVQAPDSTDSGNNPNWSFGGWKTWQGGVSGHFTNGANWAGGTAPGEADSVVFDGTGLYMPIITQATTLTRLTIGPSQISFMTANTPLTITDELLVMENGALIHSANPAGTNEPYKLSIRVEGDMTLLSGGKVDVTGKGFPATYGPGAHSNVYGGGSHGGQGEGYLQGPPAENPAVGQCYGSVLRPNRLGSGGAAQAGGGAIRLEVDGTLTLFGAVLAEGDPANYGNRTGSGGSIWITAGRLEGTGVVSVASFGYGGGGGAAGGGRLAVYVTNAAHLAAVQFKANGGYDSYRAAAGTIYLSHTGDPRGRVIVDNATVPRRSAATQFPPPIDPVTDELKLIPVIVTNTGWVALTGDARIGDLTISTNAFLSTSNHTLRVRAAEHDLGDPGLPGPGNTNRVDVYEKILWRQGTGTLILLR